MGDDPRRRTRGPMTPPYRRDIWLASLSPTQGHEQTGIRPVLVVSHDDFNAGPADLCIVVPITSRLRHIPSHVRITPPEGGLRVESAALCEAVRSISKTRLIRRLGIIDTSAMAEIDDVLRILLVL